MDEFEIRIQFTVRLLPIPVTLQAEVPTAVPQSFARTYLTAQELILSTTKKINQCVQLICVNRRLSLICNEGKPRRFASSLTEGIQVIDLPFKLNDASVMFVYTKPAVILPAEVQTVYFDHDFELHFCSELVSPLSDVGESQSIVYSC